MKDSWTCVMVGKGPGILSESIITVLKAAACDLYLNKWEMMRIKNDTVEGFISTEWKTYTVGGRSGMLFHTQVDCEDGCDYKVNFLLNGRDLRRGASILKQKMLEQDVPPQALPFRLTIPELFEFRDLSGPSRRLH